MYVVYILFAPSINKYYIGQTENIEKRLREHRLRINLGANDWLIKYTELFKTRAEAMKREKEIKAKKSRHYLESLINSFD